MTRTTVVPEASGETLGGATILPGVPLPTWGRPAEPVVPEEPVAPPAPAPVAVAPPVPVSVASASVALEDAVPTLAPAAPVAPRHAAYAAAGAAPANVPEGSPSLDLAALAAPVVPAPADPLPVDLALVPDAPAPVGLVPIDLAPPVTAPVDLAAVDSMPVEVEPDADHDRPGPERSRRALGALGVLGGVLVLGAVAAFVWPGFLVAEDEPSAPAPRPAVAVSRTVTLNAPETAAGLTRLDGAPGAALATAATGTNLSGYTAPVSAVYGTGAVPGATVIAWNATTRGGSVDVSTAFAGYQSATNAAVTGIVPVPTGKLGGQMSCGTGVVGTTPASVCFWSDDATFGAITVLKPASATAGATTAAAIRAAVETRS